MFDTESRPFKAGQKFGQGVLVARPKGIIAVSAHWEDPSNAVAFWASNRSCRDVPFTDSADLPVNTDSSNPLIYDFGGFPPHFYTQTFESKDDQRIVGAVMKALKEAGVDVMKAQRVSTMASGVSR